MAHTFEFSVVEAIPDARRGERVNIGIVVFLPTRLDIRLPEVAKLRALRDGNWDDYVAQLKLQLVTAFSPGEKPAQFLRNAGLIEGAIRFSEPGLLSIESDEQYEGRVRDILNALVIRRHTEKRPTQTRINTEIARTFRTANVLASGKDIVERDRKVFANFVISSEEELSADFLLKNGTYHVTVTLDLRRAVVGKAQAALKAIVLDKSSSVLAGGVQKIAVYAAADAQQYRPHIGILTDYADRGCVFNWLDPDQRSRYTRVIYDAINDPATFKLGSHAN